MTEDEKEAAVTRANHNRNGIQTDQRNNDGK